MEENNGDYSDASDDSESYYEKIDDYSEGFEIVDPYVREQHKYWLSCPCDGGDFNDRWEQTGEEIGRHKYLETLNFDDIETVRRERWDACMRGVASNRSIKTLEMIWLNGLWGGTFEILAPFFEHNSNLTTLTVVLSDTLVQNRELSFLSSNFRRCGTSSSLTKLEFGNVNLDDETAAEFISSLNNLPHLQELSLRNNTVGMGGCQSLAVLFRNSESKLKTLNLASNNIGDAEVAVLASALSDNNVLTALILTNTGHFGDTISFNSITEIGWETLSKVLRDSNHTLKGVSDPEYPEKEMSHPDRQHWSLPDLLAVTTNELRHLLKMNANEDKTVLAQQKAILFRHTVDIHFTSPLTELKMFPDIITWIGRQPVECRFTSLFELIRATPHLWNT